MSGDANAPEPWLRVLPGIALAWRRLARDPFHVLAVVLNLTLGIGTCVAVFSLLDGIVLKPLPYRQPDRLVLLQHEMPGIPLAGSPTRFGGFQGQVLDYAEHSTLIEQIGAYTIYDASIDADDGARHVRAAWVTAGFLQALGARPALGRLFRSPEEESPTGLSPVILDQAAWARRYGRDADALGRTLIVDGADAEVVGVLEPQGPFPEEQIALWNARTDSQVRATPQLLVDGFIVRMASGVEPQALGAELEGIIAGLPQRMPDPFIRRAVLEGRLRARITPLPEVVVGPLAGSLWLLMGGAGLVLVAALANVTGLQLLRRQTRRREQAVRRALGARPTDLARQHTAEAGMLTAIAMVAAVALARGVISWLLVSSPTHLPRAAELGLDRGDVVFAVLVGGLALLLQVAVRMAPDKAPGDILRGHAAPGARTSGSWWIRDAVAAAELAVAVILLVGAGLLLRSFTSLNRVDPGFEAEGLLSFRVPFPAREIDDAGGMAGATALYDRLADRIAALGGVESVGYGSCAPFARTCRLAGLTLVAADAPAGSSDQRLFGVLQVSPGYHETLQIPLLEGRLLRRSDHEQRSNAVVVSAAVAAALWPDRSAVGRRVLTPDLPDWSPLTVVGVVDESHHTSLRGNAEPLVYLPVLLRQQVFELAAVTFVVRASVPPLSLAGAIRSTMKGLRPDVPVAEIELLTTAVQHSVARLRFAVSMLLAASVATLLLGVAGAYGVVAYAVGLRRHEFGIRLAVGADASHLRMLALRHAATIGGTGLVAGLGLAALGARALESNLFSVAPRDPATYLLVALLLGLTVLIAALNPARRAAGTEPSAALRDV